jgi:hypothetical protein
MHLRICWHQRPSEVRAGLVLLLLLAACDRDQVAESNQAAVIERAKALEKAADASVDESIAQMTRESLEESAENEAAAQ